MGYGSIVEADAARNIQAHPCRHCSDRLMACISGHPAREDHGSQCAGGVGLRLRQSAATDVPDERHHRQTFRTQPASQVIVSGKPQMSAITLKEGEKRWFFILPAAGSIDTVTIVIVPAISLRHEYIDRCSRAGIYVCGMERIQAAT